MNPPTAISKKEVIVTILSHYLETGVIESPEIDSTISTLQSYSLQELIQALIESHKFREEIAASKCYRCPN